MPKNNNNRTLQDFYQALGGSGRHLYDRLYADFAQEAAQHGINWDAVDKRLAWDGASIGLNHNRYFTRKGEKTAGVRADFKTARNGIEYPVITISRRGEGTAEFVLNGYEDLKRLYELEGGGFVADDSWRQKQQQRMDARAAREAKAAAKAAAERERREQARLADIAGYHQDADAQDHPYLRKKQVWGSLPHCAGIKTGHNKNGHYLAIPLYSSEKLDNFLQLPEIVGIQRIYAEPFARASGEKTDKDFTFGLNKVDTGAHAIIGDLSSADRIYTCEGWATGATAFLAHQQYLTKQYGECAVIVCLDAGQLEVVIEKYLSQHPDLELVNLADNDCWKQQEGKGNKGVNTAYALAAKYPKIKHRLPDVTQADAVSQPTDFNDVALGHRRGLQEVADQLRAKTNLLELPRDPFELGLLKLATASHKDAQRQAMATIAAGMRGFPFVRNGRQIMEAVKTVVEQHRLPIDWQKLIWLANKRFDERLHEAHAFRSFSARITDPAQRPAHIHYHRIEKTVIDDGVYDFVRQLQGLVIVRAPMASGKSKNLLRPMIWQAERAASFVHRVTLVEDGHAKLSKINPDDAADVALLATMPGDALDILHYKDAEMAHLSGMKKLACCINSINKPQFGRILQRLDLLALDEASQMLRSITNGGTMAQPLAVYNRLKGCAVNASQVLMVDADANDSVVEFAERIRAERGDDTPIHVVELDTDFSDKTILYGDLNAVFDDVVAQVGQGKKVLVADDSADEGAKLQRLLEEKYPHTKGLFISQDSKAFDAKVQAFNADPDGHVEKYDWVIYSPAISSGVSIVTQHFDLHYGLFRGVISPSDAVQMIRRDRTANRFILGLTSPVNFRETSEAAMWRAALAGLAEHDQALSISVNEDGQLVVSSDDLEFDRLRINLLTQENAARNDFANTMLLQLMADKYRVEPMALEHADEMIANAKVAKKVIGELLKQEDIERHLTNPTATDEQRQQLMESSHISQDERAQLNRWNIENLLLQPVTEESVCWLRDGALAHVKRFELLQMPTERASSLDALEATNGVPVSTRQYLSRSQRLLREYMAAVGVDYNTGAGVATQRGLQAGLALLQANADYLTIHAPWCPPVRGKKAGADMFKAIMEKLNLTAVKARQSRRTGDGSTVWSIEPESWENMHQIHQKRTHSGVSAYDDIKLAAGGSERSDLVSETIHDFSDDLIEKDKIVDRPSSPVVARPAGVSYLLGKVGRRLKIALHDLLSALTYEEKAAVRDGLLDENGVLLALGSRDARIRAGLPPELALKLG